MNHTKGSLAKEILLILAGGAIFSTIMLTPGLSSVLPSLIKTLSQRTGGQPRSIKNALFRLKGDRLIDFQEKNNMIILKITDKGKKKTLMYKLEDLKITKPKKWDRLWRMVIFDIPEKRRNARTALREKLQELGFYPLQKSCFVHPFECKDEIDFISEVFQLAPYIHYVVAKSIEGEDFLKRHFGL
ncbi:MAG: hypothetical protein ACK4NX_03460 [Candidatus Paceibacteria bacterium]